MGILSYLRSRGLPWLGPRLSHRHEAEVEIEREKIATGLRSGFAGQSALFLPWIDDRTGETDKMRRAYRTMLKDPMVKASVLTKLFSTAALSLQVHPDGIGPLAKRVSSFTKWTLQRSDTGVSGLVSNILFGALVERLSVCEKVFQYIERGEYSGHVGLRGLPAIDPDTFTVTYDEHRQITHIQSLNAKLSAGVTGPTNKPVEYPKDCFAIWQHAPLYGIGMSDLRAAYRAYFMLDTVWKLRGIFLDKFALPVLKGTYNDDAMEPSLAAKLAKMRSLSWITIPEEVQVEAIELSQRSGTEWRDCILDLRQEVVVGIQLGFQHILEGTQTGARASAMVHAGQSQLAVWYTAESVGNVLTKQVGPDIVDLNFAGAGYPLITLGGVNDDDMQGSLSIDLGLNKLVPLSKKDLYERYGRQEPEGPEDTVPVANLGFSLPGMSPGGQQDADGGDADQSAANDLRNTVGGATALTQLQQAYFAGEMTREAAIANAQIIFKMSPAEAGKLFAIVTPKPPTQLADAPPQLGSASGPVVPVRPFDQPHGQKSGGETALAGRDGKRAEQLLAKAQAAGAGVLRRITEAAVKRLLAHGGKSAITARRDGLYNDTERQELADSLAATNATAELLGASRIRQRLAKVRAGIRQFAEDETDFTCFAEPILMLAPAQAIEYFTKLIPSLGVDPRRFGPRLEREAFTLAVETEGVVLDKVQKAIISRMESGIDAGAMQGGRAVQEILDQAGVSNRNPQYSEMVYRTNAQDSYQTGAMRELQDPDVTEYFPVWKYLGIKDGRQRAEHEAHFDHYFSNDTDFAEVRDSLAGEFSGYNCRCSFAPVDKFEWAELQSKGVRIG